MPIGNTVSAESEFEEKGRRVACTQQVPTRVVELSPVEAPVCVNCLCVGLVSWVMTVLKYTAAAAAAARSSQFYRPRLFYFFSVFI